MGARPQTQSHPSQPCNKINMVAHKHKACYSKVNLCVRKKRSRGEGVISVSSASEALTAVIVFVGRQDK